MDEPQPHNMRRPGGIDLLLATTAVAPVFIGYYMASIFGENFVPENLPAVSYSTANLFGEGFQLVSMIILIVAANMLKEVRWKITSILLAVSFAFQGFELAFPRDAPPIIAES